MATDVVRGGIRLPCSSTRTSRDKFLKLLSAVDPDADHGFGFEGAFFRPGQLVTDAELRPSPDFPITPVILEFMRGPAYGIAGHRRADSIYILWRYEGNAWKELGRACSSSWQWALELRPLAVRALREARGGGIAVIMPDLPAIAVRIASALDKELRPLESADQRKVIAVLHDQIAARLCV